MKNMEYIRVTKENLDREHICRAISNNRDIQVSSKKAWLSERFDEGVKKPGLKACAKHPRTEARGYVLHYTSQCPFEILSEKKFLKMISG